MAAAGEFAVILGDRILIAGGNLVRVGVADGAAPAFIELAAQLQFQRIHAADELLVHLLDQGGIPGETAGIQFAHLIDQRLQLLPRFGTILHYGANLVEQIQTLVNLALGIGRIGTLLGRHCLTGDAGIAGVIGAKPVAIAIPATGHIAYRTGDAVADRTRFASAGLACLPSGLTRLASGSLAAGLTALTALPGLAALLPLLAVLRWLLAGLTGLPAAELRVAGELAGLGRLAGWLPGTTGLALSSLRAGLRVGTSAEAVEPVAQTG